MKSKLTILTLIFSAFCAAQVPMVLTGSFTASGTSAVFDNRTVGAYQFQVSYNSTGFSALSIQLEQAPDVSGAPGSWAAFTGSTVVTDGSNPSTNTNAATIGIHSAAAWVRLNLASATGSGTVKYQVWGANSVSTASQLKGLSPIVVAGRTISCPTCGTSTGSVTGVSATPPLKITGGASPTPNVDATYEGNGSKIQLFTGADPATNDCAKFDANHNIVTAGSACSSGSAFPFLFLQEACYGFANTNSWTVTFPATAASSGATLFMVVATDAANTITAPAGWSTDFNQTQTTSSRVMLMRIASASQTSATITSGGNSGAAIYFFELSGTHALDQSVLGGVAISGLLAFPAITPSANSMVIAFTSLSPSNNPPLPVYFPNLNPLWRLISIAPTVAANDRTFAGFVMTQGATGLAVRPPALNTTNLSLIAGTGMAYAVFSIL